MSPTLAAPASAWAGGWSRISARAHPIPATTTAPAASTSTGMGSTQASITTDPAATAGWKLIFHASVIGPTTASVASMMTTHATITLGASSTTGRISVSTTRATMTATSLGHGSTSTWPEPLETEEPQLSVPS